MSAAAQVCPESEALNHLSVMFLHPMQRTSHFPQILHILEDFKAQNQFQYKKQNYSMLWTDKMLIWLQLRLGFFQSHTPSKAESFASLHQFMFQLFRLPFKVKQTNCSNILIKKELVFCFGFFLLSYIALKQFIATNTTSKMKKSCSHAVLFLTSLLNKAGWLPGCTAYEIIYESPEVINCMIKAAL